MPVRWRTNFVNSGQNVQDVSIEVLCPYMVQQEAQMDAHRKKIRETNKKNQKVPFNKSKGGKYKKFGKSPYKNNDKDSKKGCKLLNNDAYPIHGGSYKWGQCHQNQYGKNFRPRRSDNQSSSSSTQSRSQRQAFHQEPPNQVQIFLNKSRNTALNETNDNRSLCSNISGSSAPRYPTSYPPGYGENQYREQMYRNV